MARDAWLFLCVVVLLLSGIYASLAIGIRVIEPFTVAGQVLSGAPPSLEAVLFSASRLPRTLLACAVGAGLGLAGALLQTVTRNVLADPGLLGINAGAAFAVVLAFSVSDAPPSLVTLGLVAAFGAAMTGVCAFLLAGGSRTFDAQPLRLVLSGGVLAIALGSLTQVLLLLQPGAFEASQVWLAGSFADRPIEMVRLYTLPALLFLILGLLLAPGLKVLLLSDIQGRSLGINVARLRLIALGVAAALCGVAVSLAGPIAFVGLIAPHIGRAVAGQRLLPAFTVAALAGATLVLFADVLARRVVSPAELPVGILIAAAGVPFYLVLLRRRITL